jgi:DNA-binding NarL/FixJ family response regulator
VTPIRVVLGEDNVLVREGVRALLNSYDDIEVVGVAADAPSLLATAEEHLPDVVVTDIKMPPSFRLEGIDCAHEIRSMHPDTGVVVLSAHDDEAYALALLGGGHRGLAYLLKDRIAQGDELARAIREVRAGRSVVDPTIAERLAFLQNSLGAVPGPFDAWLVLRGLKTLALRMRKHCENARAIAELLDGHPRVERVLYPGLPDHPGHELAARQMSDFGGIVSFLADDAEEAAAVVARTKIFKLAESLGGVESLIEHPARMTHASTADAPFAAPRNLVRLSVGIESAEDLVEDLETALVRSAAIA